MQKLHKIEKKFNRTRDTRWGARTLDLDLLAQEGQVVPNEEIFREIGLSKSDLKTLEEQGVI